MTSSEKRTVIYRRISTSNQKDDLKNQVDFLRQYVNAEAIIAAEVIRYIIAILHIFSCRIYGLRKYKKR